MNYDFIGIGVGPFNLGLACLSRPIEGLRGLFLERRERFDWHPGMLLENATLQTPFLADLVTLADPTSPYSFLNYLKVQGRIYSFYIREDFFLLRGEFNQYCQWVAEQLPNLQFGRYVERIDYDESAACYVVHAVNTQTASATYRAKRLVLGTGTVPWLPPGCRAVADRISHSSTYLNDKPVLLGKSSITLVGSGQSAAEIYYGLLQDIDRHGYALHWFTRSPRFFPLEYTKLTLEMTSPEYIDYFYALPSDQRERLLAGQKGLYKGINGVLINDIYRLLYAKRVNHAFTTTLATNTVLRACRYDEKQRRFELELEQHEQGIAYRHATEGLILATGYTRHTPEFLQPIAMRIRWDAQQRYAVARNYSIDHAGNEIFVQNAELHTHGLAAPDLGMACYRNASILRELVGYEVYPIERRIAFQQFGAPLAPATVRA